MNTILKIYKRDVRNIITNPVLVIVVIALFFIPALYAWINIIASWDPYGNTKELSVAVVDKDTGASFRNIHLAVGKEVVNKLKNNQSIGWTFVNSKEAEDGVKYGKYYASITIPEDFSKSLLSIVNSEEPKKARLIYSVNEKINAIAPKITKSGLTSLQNEITVSFTEEASSTVFNYLNAYGLELEKAKPEIKRLIDLVVDTDNKLPKIGEDIDNTYKLATDIHGYVQNIHGNLPTITDTLNKTSSIVSSSTNFLNNANNTLKNIPVYIKTDLNTAKDNADTAKTDLSNINASLASGISGQQQSLKTVSDKLSSASTSIDNTINILQSINRILNNNTNYTFINSLQNIRNGLNQDSINLNNFIDTLDNGSKVSSDAINSTIQSINRTSQLIDDAGNNFDNNISPSISNLINDSTGISTNLSNLLQNAQSNMPLVNNLLKDAEVATGASVDRIKDIKDKFPQIQQSIHSNVEKFKNLSDDEKFNEFLKLLQRNTKAESEFLANPITLEQNRVFPIPNYGSAMTPFYTTLAIWVGAFTLLSLLSVKVKPLDDMKVLGAREEFFGRYLTIVTITTIQALIVSLGNILMLKVYAVSPFMFVVFSVYVSIVFTMIVYTLVSVFGNVGKALALVLMVLQVSASGGTFPIQLTPKFFQNISPMLPFTYSIGGMRETQGGIILSALYRNVGILAIYFIVSIIIAIFLKEKINEKFEKSLNKIKKSGLVGD